MRVAQAEIAVETGHLVGAVGKLAAGEDGAHIRLGVQVVAHAPHERLRRLARGAVDDVVGVTRRLVVRIHDADGRVAGLAGQLRAVARVDDRARVHQIDRPAELEDLGALQEERPQLRIEQREAPVHLDLRPVRLDLRKVGVERHVCGQIRRDAVLEVQPALRPGAVVREPAGRVELAELHRRERRQDLDVAAGRQSGHAVEHAHLRQEPGHLARHRRPDDRLVLAADARAIWKPQRCGVLPPRCG